MNHDFIDDDNFVLFAAKHYDNPQCYDAEEFYDDLKRFKYLKRLFGKYEESGELRERLILNHLIILYNVFGDVATKMLFYKLDGYYSYLLPFLVLLHRLPEKVNVGKTIYTSDIPLDNNIVEVLRKI
ncbi:hypothetical protein UFOVP447_184 [uncultured Caudovirales phage]|uniref:Uncharacterized protein n=1 Tax=uncultured Caudovirales phage TaxID=2100421 RepID=A0A6J5MJ17_9CAUD|nr:hypothetical protein UFOVP447_184 [uncultured Caudovirales phage]